MGFMLPVGSFLISVILFTSFENAPVESSFAAAGGPGGHQSVGPRFFPRPNDYGEGASLLGHPEDDVPVVPAADGHVVAGDDSRDLVDGHVMPSDVCRSVLLDHQSTSTQISNHPQAKSPANKIPR